MTNSFDFDTPVERRGTDSYKWFRFRDRDVLPMWVADMDFRCPEPIVEALRQRVEHGIFGYALVSDELRHCVVEMLRRDYGWATDPHWQVWFPGVMTGVSALCRAVGEAGDEVLALVPAYPPFLEIPEPAGRRLVKVEMVENGGRWEIDFDRLRAAITPRTRAIMWCNPQNPTGRIFSRQELAALGEICLQHDIYISSDEIHCGLVLDAEKRHLPIAALSPELARRTVTIMGPSKTFNIPGLYSAFAIVPDERLRKSIKHAMSGLVANVDTLGLVATLAAYRDCRPWQAALLDYLRGNRDLVEAAVAGTAPLRMSHVEATYLAWIDARQLGLGDESGKFFEERGLGLMEGRYFGQPGFVRLNFGCPRSLLNEGLSRLRRAVQSRRG